MSASLKSSSRFAICVLLLWCVTVVAHGQQLRRFLPVAPETFSNSFVRCFFKDSRGYMWIGTGSGLVRYDGTNSYRFEHDPQDNHSLCHNNINIIQEDSRKRLWVGTSMGMCIYDPEKDHFVRLDSLPGNLNHPNNQYVTSLSFDQQDNAWIGTHGGGVNVYNQKTRTFSYLVDGADGNLSRATNYVNMLLPLDGLMWCATKGGLRVFRISDKKSVPLTFVEGSLPDHQFTHVVPDKVGNLWLATLNGDIVKLTQRNGYYTHETIVSRESVGAANWNYMLTMCMDDRGNLWVGGENSGLNYIDTKSGKVVRYLSPDSDRMGLPTTSVRTVYIDNKGITWVGTFNKGAFRIDNNAGIFQYQRSGDLQETLTGTNIRGFAEDRSGNIWIATEDWGLAKLDGMTRTIERMASINRKIDTRYLTAVLYDRHGNLWVGTGGKGVYKVNSTTGGITRFPLKSGGFGDDKTSTLYEDKRGTIWAGTAGSGLFYFDESSRQFQLLSEQTRPGHITRTSYVSVLTEDSDSVLWVGTMYGLHALRRNGDHTFDYQGYWQQTKSGGLSSSSVQSLHEDRSGNLWIGTADNGINLKRKNAQTFEVYRKKEGLPSNTVRAILSDAGGNLWIAGNMGLSKFDPRARRFINYSTRDGLSSNDFYPNSSLRSSTGDLFFGSNNGFNAFYPDSVHISAEPPVVYFSDLKINNKSATIGMAGSPLDKHISLTSAIELRYDQRSFIIDFSSVNPGRATESVYCYKLEGFDYEWNCGSSNHSATYTNLDPGTYVFLAKAFHRDGGWSVAPTRLEITIHQSVWKSWWAVAIYVVIVTAILAAFMRFRIERLKMRNQLNMERIAREQEHELNESKTQFFTNISHEFRTPLSLVVAPLETLLASDNLPPLAKERVQTAYRSADKLMNLLNELMDFSKLEYGKMKLNVTSGDLVKFIIDVASIFNDLADRKNINFSIRTEARSADGWFDRDKLEKMLVNVLSNAFKFTGEGGRIHVNISIVETFLSEKNLWSRCLQIVVVDNGIGISEDELPRIFDKFFQAKSAARIANPGTGIGLSLTKSLVDLHHGSITAVSTPDRETRFTIVLPIDKHVYEDAPEGDTPVCAADEAGSAAVRSTAGVVHGGKDKAEILIVEDNDELREYLLSELKSEFLVLEARNGEEGLAVALERSPDLIISDILMERLNGIEFCRIIKSDVKTSHIPFILLTAKANIEDQVTGIETGADLYITKPFSLRYLLSHVRNIIASRQKLYAHFSHDVYLMPAKLASNQLDEAFLSRVVEYIMSHIQDPQLGVDAMAETFNLSKTQLYRKIKSLTGKTAVEFIRTVRLKQALKLMETKKYMLSEIAWQTGFNSASYFTRSFKEEYGKAPSEYLETDR